MAAAALLSVHLVISVILVTGPAGCAPGAFLGGDALSDEDAAVRALHADVQPRTIVEEQLLACIVAAGTAANLTGANDFVTTGTLDVRGAEPSYSASPDDELVLREDGHDTRYLIDAIAISEVDSISQILLHDHEVRARVLRDDAFDLDLASRRTNDVLDRSAEGLFEEDGFTFELDLGESGSSVMELNGDILRYDSNERTVSHVTGEDVDVEIEEDEDYILILSDRAFENRTTVTTLDATIAGKSLRMDDGRVRRSFVDSAPAEPDFWAETAGELELDGEVVGELAFEQGGGGAYQILLKLQGDDEVLESYTP